MTAGTRAAYLQVVREALTEPPLVVSPTGAAFVLWEKSGDEGHLSHVNLGSPVPVAVGLALALPHRRVLAIDGDGSLSFNLSGLVEVGFHRPANLVVLVFDDGLYHSCGVASPTAFNVDLAGAARSCGVADARTVSSVEEFASIAHEVLNEAPCVFVCIRLPRDEVDPVGRVVGEYDGHENKYRFARHVETTERIRVLRPYGRRHGDDLPGLRG